MDGRGKHCQSFFIPILGSAMEGHLLWPLFHWFSLLPESRVSASGLAFLSSVSLFSHYMAGMPSIIRLYFHIYGFLWPSLNSSLLSFSPSLVSCPKDSTCALCVPQRFLLKAAAFAPIIPLSRYFSPVQKLESLLDFSSSTAFHLPILNNICKLSPIWTTAAWSSISRTETVLTARQ